MPGLSWGNRFLNPDFKDILSEFIAAGNVIGKADFIKNKRMSGRPKDLADIAYLEGDD